MDNGWHYKMTFRPNQDAASDDDDEHVWKMRILWNIKLTGLSLSISFSLQHRRSQHKYDHNKFSEMPLFKDAWSRLLLLMFWVVIILNSFLASFWVLNTLFRLFKLNVFTAWITAESTATSSHADNDVFVKKFQIFPLIAEWLLFYCQSKSCLWQFS